MSRKVQLRLIVSAKMTSASENDVIRFPKKARQNLSFSNNRVILGIGDYETVLEVRKAYKPDVSRLARLIREGKVTDREARCLGFVSRAVHRRITSKQGPNIWVSDGTGAITVGADPEFGLIDGAGFLRKGSTLIPKMGQFGSDGPSVEVRPPPDKSHIAVVGNIKDILRDPPPKAEDFRWIGGATFVDANRTYWFGGHIHLGRPSQIPADEAYPIYEKIASVLDALLALPMVRFDTPEPHKRRNGCTYDYGKAGDIRSDYEAQNRFEYRVLSGLWLVHPTLAKIVIGTAKCIAETAYDKIAQQGMDVEWATRSVSQTGMLKSFGLSKLREIGGIINRARPEGVTPECMRNWKRQIRKLDHFDDYAEELEALIALATTAPKGFDLDIKKNWREEVPLVPNPATELKKALQAVEEK